MAWTGSAGGGTIEIGEQRLDSPLRSPQASVVADPLSSPISVLLVTGSALCVAEPLFRAVGSRFVSSPY